MEMNAIGYMYGVADIDKLSKIIRHKALKMK